MEDCNGCLSQKILTSVGNGSLYHNILTEDDNKRE